MDNLLISSLKLLSMKKEAQIKYIKDLFNDLEYECIEEILLEYEDARYLIDNYNSDNVLKEMFITLDIILNKINDHKLFSEKDLDSFLWNEARNKANNILDYLRFSLIR